MMYILTIVSNPIYSACKLASIALLSQPQCRHFQLSQPRRALHQAPHLKNSLAFDRSCKVWADLSGSQVGAVVASWNQV